MDMLHHPCNIWIPPSCPFLLLPVLVVLAWIGLISAPEPPGQWRRGAYRSQQSNESSPQIPGGKDKLLLCWGHCVCPVLGTLLFLWVEEKPGTDD